MHNTHKSYGYRITIAGDSIGYRKPLKIRATEV
jgi:hypothetical protein